MKLINSTVFTFIDLKGNIQNCLIPWNEKYYGIIPCKLCCKKKKGNWWLLALCHELYLQYQLLKEGIGKANAY